MSSIKFKALEFNRLWHLLGTESVQKKGTPKNAGITRDVYENKG